MSINSAILPNIGAVLAIAQIIKSAMSSITEAKLCTIFINCREAFPTFYALEEMCHIQPSTPMQTNNNVALSVVTNSIASKRSIVIKSP